MPLAEHDGTDRTPRTRHQGFNSRAPRGARPDTDPAAISRNLFQFTCPSRSTTQKIEENNMKFLVSIHVPLAEHDADIHAWLNGFEVSIHVPLAEHDSDLCSGRRTPAVSIHVPLAEHDKKPGAPGRMLFSFNSRAPRGARQDPRRRRAPLCAFQFTCPSRSTTFFGHRGEH